MPRYRVVVTSLLIVGGLAACLLLIVWKRWHIGRVSGDVIASDAGYWSYPRYKFAFPRIDSSNQTGSAFAVAGLPRDPLTFTLEVVGTRSGKAAVPEVVMEGSRVSVRIVDRSNVTVYEGSDHIARWRWNTSVTHIALWHESLCDMRFDPGESYTVEIAIQSEHDEIDAIVFEPRLSGGGNELP